MDEWLMGSLTVGLAYHLKMRTMQMDGTLRAIVVGSTGEPITLHMDTNVGMLYVPWNAIEAYNELPA